MRAGQAVAKILSSYPRQSVTDQPETYIDSLVMAVMGQPMDTVEALESEVPRRCKFVPTVADLVEVMREHNAARQRDQHRPMALPPPAEPAEQYDPAALEQMAADAVAKGNPWGVYLSPDGKKHTPPPTEAEIEERRKRKAMFARVQNPTPNSAIKAHMSEFPEKYLEGTNEPADT